MNNKFVQNEAKYPIVMVTYINETHYMYRKKHIKYTMAMILPSI